MADLTINADLVRDRFNLQYNFSNSAPGLEDSEISMYLTMAHIEILDEYSATVDMFEKNRSILSPYIYEDEIPGSLSNVVKFYKLHYQSFKFTKTYWRIIREYIKTVKRDWIKVKPTQYDTFNKMVDNPYRWPTTEKALRLDVKKDVNTDANVKIFFKQEDSVDYIKTYNVTYLTSPEVFDLENSVIPSQIVGNSFMSEKVINRAVELATRDIKENSLQNQVQINSRSK